MRTIISMYLSMVLHQMGISLFLLFPFMFAAVYEDYLTIINKRKAAHENKQD
tara:strand:+ start:1495 stop:1650 length:156 start_codon:yes stop_codon:yes gene_type:complete